MRMIDRWFPCAQVSDASYQPYGSGRVEKSLFTWFAARPIAQARAAALTTLLPWPDDLSERHRLQQLVLKALVGDIDAHKTLAEEVQRSYPQGVRTLDPFSGRAIVPLEAARAGAESWGLDYSPVATLSGMLLADFPFRDWSAEPPLPFDEESRAPADAAARYLRSTVEESRLARDVRRLLNEIGIRYEAEMNEFYPRSDRGERPWAYLWAQTMPCDECHNYFPVVGSTVLRLPNRRRNDVGASFTFITDRGSGDLQIVIHEGVMNAATFLKASGGRGRIARCPFCAHPHPLDVLKGKAQSGLMRDRLLIVAERNPTVSVLYRLPTDEEQAAVVRAIAALKEEKPFPIGVPAVPDEPIPPGNHDTIRASLYGVQSYGAMCCDRQTLGFVRLCRIINNLQAELNVAGLSDNYIRALLGYAGSVVVRKLRRSTRGATLLVSNQQIDHIFKNQASLNYGFDFMEAGIGEGAGTWDSIMSYTVNVVQRLTRGNQSAPARLRQGSALHLPFKPKSISAIITDPPYYNMIDYCDATDLFFVWLKRALGTVFPELFDASGLQDKAEEIIVKRGGVPGEHRTSKFYTSSLKQAFTNARRVLKDDGGLTLVFGHSDPEAWRLLLTALLDAGFIITGAWPARTEESGGADAANIVVTVTIACHPAPAVRPDGLQATVDLEVDHEVRSRIPTWERDGLALTDQLMASYGPAMEVLGRYAHVMRPDGTPVEIDHYLSLARRTIQDAAAIKVDGLPLETFDARTRFALFWARLYGRQLAPKSEAVFQAMASNLRLDDVRRDILEESTKGYRLADFGDQRSPTDYDNLSNESSVIDVVRVMVRAWRASGGEGVTQVLTLSERDPDDAYLWAVVTDLSSILPPSDRDRKAMDDILRNRRAIGQFVRTTMERRQSGTDPVQLPMFTAEKPT